MLNKITKSAALAFIGGLTLLTIGCKKNETVSPIPKAGTARQLTKIEQDAANYSTFEYNADNRLAKIMTKEDGDTESIELAYGADKKIAGAKVNTMQLNFIYANGTLNKLEYRQADGVEVALYTEFTNKNNKVTETSSFVNLPGGAIPSIKTVYTYNAGGDAATQTEYDWSPVHNAYELQETISFEYDDKVNPLAVTSEIAQAFFQVMSAHNITRSVKRNADNVITETSIYTYTYDAQNYPVVATEKKTTAENPNVITTQTKYSYKN